MKFLCLLLILLQQPQTKIDDDDKVVVFKLSISGNDLKVRCLPENDKYTILVLGDVVRIVFDPPADGLYVFSVATNEGGKTSVAMHSVQVGKNAELARLTKKLPQVIPQPIIEPDNFHQRAQNAYTVDLKDKLTGKMDRDRLLESLRAAQKLIETAKDRQEIYTALHKDIEYRQIKGVIKLREEIFGELAYTFGSDAKEPVDKKLAATAFDNIIKAVTALQG